MFTTSVLISFAHGTSPPAPVTDYRCDCYYSFSYGPEARVETHTYEGPATPEPVHVIEAGHDRDFSVLIRKDYSDRVHLCEMRVWARELTTGTSIAPADEEQVVSMRGYSESVAAVSVRARAEKITYQGDTVHLADAGNAFGFGYEVLVGAYYDSPDGLEFVGYCTGPNHGGYDPPVQLWHEQRECIVPTQDRVIGEGFGSPEHPYDAAQVPQIIAGCKTINPETDFHTRSWLKPSDTHFGARKLQEFNTSFNSINNDSCYANFTRSTVPVSWVNEYFNLGCTGFSRVTGYVGTLHAAYGNTPDPLLSGPLGKHSYYGTSAVDDQVFDYVGRSPACLDYYYKAMVAGHMVTDCGTTIEQVQTIDCGVGTVVDPSANVFIDYDQHTITDRVWLSGSDQKYRVDRGGETATRVFNTGGATPYAGCSNDPTPAH